ncbi:MAG TPA: 50S ribosomal protein L22 [Phycisphaerales bacterium]|nr:50S ribosomal protein L22 [Phycisphaerales bacterium]
MKLRYERLKELAQAKGVSREQLAAAIVRPGLSEGDAIRAINNWMVGRDHPRCRATDIAKLAAAVGVPTRELARFVSEVRHHRGSPRKARLLADLIRGKSVEKALNLLGFNTKRAAVNMRKCLSAAIAEAQTVEADEGKLFVSISTVDDGPVMKRFQPKDRGRAHAILKRFSHITVGVEERLPKTKKAAKAG